MTKRSVELRYLTRHVSPWKLDEKTECFNIEFPLPIHMRKQKNIQSSKKDIKIVSKRYNKGWYYEFAQYISNLPKRHTSPVEIKKQNIETDFSNNIWALKGELFHKLSFLGSRHWKRKNNVYVWSLRGVGAQMCDCNRDSCRFGSHSGEWNIWCCHFLALTVTSQTAALIPPLTAQCLMNSVKSNLSVLRRIVIWRTVS